MTIPRIFTRRWFQFLTVIIILLGVYFGWQFTHQPKKEVKTHTVTRQNIQQTVTASGKVTAKDTAILRFQAPGKLAWVGVQKGDFVKKWQAIASLDVAELQNKLQQAALTADIQQNTFENTIIDYDYAYTSFENGEYQTRGDEDGYYKRILENNKANLDKANLTRDLTALAKQYAYLYSPIDGIVIQATDLYPGVMTSATTQYVIIDPATLRFTAEVEEGEISNVYEGMTATILLDAYPDLPLTSAIQEIEFTSTTTTSGNTAYAVHLPINLTDDIRMDMNGDVNILLSEKTDVLAIPIEAVAEMEDSKQVTIQTQDQKTETRTIMTGIETDDYFEVLEGLSVGDIIVLP